MNNIYLIGMPGCGKSTIARIISKHLNKEYIDADVYLEKKYNECIADIFAVRGEADFRLKETSVLEELSQKDDIIISTGGGVVVTYKNKDIMKKTGVVIFIDCQPEVILSNSSLSGRPLLKDKTRIFELYKERIDLYKNFSDIIIDNNGKIEDTVSQIINCFIQNKKTVL